MIFLHETKRIQSFNLIGTMSLKGNLDFHPFLEDNLWNKKPLSIFQQKIENINISGKCMVGI